MERSLLIMLLLTLVLFYYCFSTAVLLSISYFETRDELEQKGFVDWKTIAKKVVMVLFTSVFLFPFYLGKLIYYMLKNGKID